MTLVAEHRLLLHMVAAVGAHLPARMSLMLLAEHRPRRRHMVTMVPGSMLVARRYSFPSLVVADAQYVEQVCLLS